MASTLANSTFLDFAGGALTNATTVADAYQFSQSDSYIQDDVQLTIGIALDRANDPATLLAMDWGQRAKALAAMTTANTLWSTYGADQATYDKIVRKLEDKGIGLASPSTNLVSSAASHTIWVTVNADQFKTLFGRDLYANDNTGATSTGTLYYWNGDLKPNDLFGGAISGLWIDQAVNSPVSTLTSAPGVTLPQGAQSIGNDADETQVLGPAALSTLFDMPLANAPATPTGTIALAEPNITDYLPKHLQESYAQAVTEFRQLAGIGGTANVYVDQHIGPGDSDLDTGNRSERDLDVGVLSDLAPNSTIGLYNGSGNTTLTSYFSAIWDTLHNPEILSTSFVDGNRVAGGSVFRAFVDGLYTDAALHGMSVLYASGDGGSSDEQATGLPEVDGFADSPYAIIVGGTSLATFGTAATDATLSTLVTSAMAGDRTTIRLLVQGGMLVLPTNATAADRAVESVWNQYSVTKLRINPGYTDNNAGTGGVDTSTAIPSYQLAFGLTPTSAGPNGGTGRGEPDVSALAGGDADYLVPNEDYNGTSDNGGTSAAAPLWAALTAQINAVFADQGLPALGYYNDLLYIAAAVAPGSFDDVQLGTNTSSFYDGGPYTSVDFQDDHTRITPTGLGYDAGRGYDLATGLGTPNGLLLARALTQIAQAQSYSLAPSMSDSTGSISTVRQTLLIQPHLSSAGSVQVAGMSLGTGAAAAQAWDAQLAEQSVQPGFDPALVNAFDKDGQSMGGEVTVDAGTSLTLLLDGQATTSVASSLTSPFGFVTDTAADGDSVTLARPVAIAQTAQGADDQDVVVRLRQDAFLDDKLTFYRVDDLTGAIGGTAPGQTGYAQLAASRAYHFTDGSTSVASPGQGQSSTAELTGVNASDIIASMLQVSGNQFWGFSAANEAASNGANGGQNHLWNYGLNTWGYEDLPGGGDHDYNDLVYQLDFTSAAGHHLLA